MVDADAEIDTEASTTGLTVIVIELDVAGLFAVQDRLDVITQVTTSPFTRPDVV